MGVALLAGLCAGLGLLQYRWTGEISGAERQRLRTTLAARLATLAREFNAQMMGACAEAPLDAGAHRMPKSFAGMFRRSEVSRFPDGGPDELPVSDNPLVLKCPPMPPDGAQRLLEFDPAYLRDKILPDYLNRYLADSGKLDYDVEVVGAALSPASATPAKPAPVIYQSLADAAHPIGTAADGEIPLLGPQFGMIAVRVSRFRRFRMEQYPQAPDEHAPDARPEPRREIPPDAVFIERNGPRQVFIGRAGSGQLPFPPDKAPREAGMWTLRVRHRAGSLEALVHQVRLRNLAVSSGLLLLILATALMLVRFSRRAQRLAELEMNFVAGVSHELRTPLTVIHTAAFNLRGKLARQPEQVEQYGALIQRESAKLGALVEQVLRFASSGRMPRKPEPVDVHALVERSMPPAGEDQGLTIEQQIARGLPPVLADTDAAALALRNLIDNARKHGTCATDPKGCWIGIAARPVTLREGLAVEISVSDHGPGIPADELQHVFEPFFRGKDAIAEQIHGTGLGLSLVKKMVEAQGGSVRVESEPGRGAAFFIRLPAAAGPAPESA
ncbi:MAG TPA: HAMP domain-containing sensor histidine kinase [Bryobacteraceae bacterium]|nr:HAMP domain-containing sensor histidine kinase [Bryobacteraceae bacterium]